MRAVSFHGFGGAFAYACRDLGIELVAACEPGGFGADMVAANRETMRFSGPIHVEQDPPAYDDIDIVLGNPPCSGFSLLNSSKGVKARGPASTNNDCMWALVRYAARCNDGHGPRAVIFESVQAAGTLGRNLMRDLRNELSFLTKEAYTLTHVFMSGASVGAAQIRKRYFFVCTKRPFGIDPPEIEKVVTYRDAIGDLVGLNLTHDFQPVDQPQSEWASGLTWKHEGEPWVADHVKPDDRYVRMAEAMADYWEIGDNDHSVVKKYVAAKGEIPPHWREQDYQKVAEGRGFAKVFRIRPDSPGYVIAGTGGYSFMHWAEPRILTVRECARLMGFPDESRWDFTTPAKAFSLLGKQVTVQSWTWALGWVKRCLEDNPGWWRGNYADAEWVIDVTHDYKKVYHDRKRLHGVDARSQALKDEMDARKPSYKV